MKVVLVILLAFFFVLCFGGTKTRNLVQDKEYQPIRNSDGYYMLDDMLLDENQIKLFYGKDKNGAANVNRWPNGVIPYRYSAQIPSHDRKAIKGSLQIFNEQFRGCLRTRLATPRDRKYVLIKADYFGNGNGKCYSNLGMNSVGINSMSLAPICVKHHDIVLHEFLHAFGVFHTHQRRDRDDYINVHWDNIIYKRRRWYQKMKKNMIDQTIRGVPYDELSLMHYKGYANTIDKKKPSVTSKSGVSAHQIGMRKQIGDAHKLLLRKMYNCKDNLPKIPCMDKKRKCKNWAKNGWCEKKPGYMRPHCRNSCGLCDDFKPRPPFGIRNYF